jgi:hypothetical protein
MCAGCARMCIVVVMFGVERAMVLTAWLFFLFLLFFFCVLSFVEMFGIPNAIWVCLNVFECSLIGWLCGRVMKRPLWMGMFVFESFIWSHFSWLLSLYLTAVSQTAFCSCVILYMFSLLNVCFIALFGVPLYPFRINSQFLQHLSININQFSTHKRCLCVLLNTDTFVYNFFY